MRDAGVNGQPKQIYLITMDAECQRNLFRGFHINAKALEDEFRLDGNSSTHNCISGFNHHSQTSFKIGQWSQF